MKIPKLGPWVHTQRKNYRNDDILPKRLALLNSIYFTWEGAKAARDQMAWMNEHVSKNCRLQNVAYKNTIDAISLSGRPEAWILGFSTT